MNIWESHGAFEYCCGQWEALVSKKFENHCSTLVVAQYAVSSVNVFSPLWVCV